jgi:hypothetical protein
MARLRNLWFALITIVGVALGGFSLPSSRLIPFMFLSYVYIMYNDSKCKAILKILFGEVPFPCQPSPPPPSVSGLFTLYFFFIYFCYHITVLLGDIVTITKVLTIYQS